MATLKHTIQQDPEDKLRTRNWSTIIYPESVDPDYLDILKESGIQAVISPLHDKDLIKDSQEFKKPHYHVILKFSGQKSRKQVKEFISAFGGVGAEDVKSMPGSVQYLWHMNDPDKAQYNKSDCVCINGFDLERYMPAMDKNLGFCEVIDYIEQNDLTHFSSLLRDIMKDRPELVPVCRRDSYSIVNYLKSRENELNKQRMQSQAYAAGNGFRSVPKDFDF